MGNIIDQLELELAAPPGETGVERAERNAEPDWWQTAMEAIARLAQTGEPFDAYTLTVEGVPAPDHANRWGALFRSAKSAGMIRHHRYHQSQRPGRASGVCSTWVGIASLMPKNSHTGQPQIVSETTV